MKTAIVVLGHGSKAPQALETMKAYGQMIKHATGNTNVEIASLQFNRPNLPEALENAIEKGATKIVIVPMFLYNGIHMQEDIPQIIKDEETKHPGVEIVLAEHLGADRRIVEIAVDRIREVS